MAILRYKRLISKLTSAMRMHAQEAGMEKVEIDVSGGIDSALVAALSCIAFGSENVIGVFSDINSSEKSKARAKMLSETFKFKLVSLDLSSVYSEIVDKVTDEFVRLGLPMPGSNNKVVFGSLRSCLRAPVGRFVNRCFGGGIRQGTGNRDEDEFLRFYQKGGDGEVDCNWIACLYKSEVKDLSRYLGVPEEIVNARPTPDLWGVEGSHYDEDELLELTGAELTYEGLDGGIGTIEWATRENDRFGIISKKELNPEDLVRYDQKEVKVIMAMRKMELATRHKAQLPQSLDRSELEYENIVA